MNANTFKYNERKQAYDRYLAMIEQRLQNNPHDHQALLHKAIMFYIFYQEFDEAEAILQSIIEKDPQNVDAYLWYGDFQRFGWGDSTDAAKYFRKALEIDPFRADCHAALAGALSEMKNIAPEEVEYFYRKSFELEPTLINPRFYLAYYLFFDQGKFKEARHELEEALRYVAEWPTSNPVEEYYESMITGRFLENKARILDFITRIDAAEAASKLQSKEKA